MQKLQVIRIIPFVAVATFAAWSVATRSFAQEPVRPRLHGYSTVVPWTGGTTDDALFQAASGTTIPMAHYNVTGTRGTYSGVIVGGNPFGKDPDTVNLQAVVIPLIIQVWNGSTYTTFDPTKPNSCDGGVSAETRFKKSPLVSELTWSMNGVNVGDHQYINAFMRAEFWNATTVSKNLSDPIGFSFAASLTMPSAGPGFGTVQGSGCNAQGIVYKGFFDTFLNVNIAVLQSSGVISPTKFAVFLMKNVVLSSSSDFSNCCIGGYHGATGSPVQTFAVMDYDTSGQIGNFLDISVPSHEIGEWMNDPLGTNPTPKWGNIGQVSGCQSNFEVGDPLSGTFATITLNGYDYHVQELAFITWFFDPPGAISFGAGEKFSNGGSFSGPSYPCPPGGTY